MRIVIPFPAGGSLDVVMRLFNQRLAETMGQGVVLDTRPGASGNIGTDMVARAAPDGYTLLSNSLPLVVNPSLFGNLQHDVERDFAPVSLLAAAPFVLTVHPSLPVSTVKELVVFARARPGELNYASAGSGTNLHVAAELFKNMARLKIVHVPYKGGGPALGALIGGETHMSFLAVMAVVPHVQSGRLRALAMTSSTRSPAMPGLPTIAESGLPGYEFSSWYGVLAPRATPADRVAALNGHFRNALRSPEMAERFSKEGADVLAGTSEEFGRHLRIELGKWAKVVKESGLKAE